MQIDYELKDTGEYGKGIFVKQDLKKGDVIYDFDKGNKVLIGSLEELKKFFEDKD